jgi:PAS domain S-box-containing protein
MSALRIVLLEDNQNDATLIEDLLVADHFVCEIIRVQTHAEFVAALRTPGLDLILADYKLPSFDGLSALKLALSACPDVPFILVSGTLGEELAVEALKMGATDYVLKTRLTRLVPSVQRALREARERADRKKAQEALRESEMYLAEAQRLSHTGSFGWHVSSGKIFWSDETYRIFAVDRTITPTIETVVERTHPEDRVLVQEIIALATAERRAFTAEHRLMTPDGSVKYVRAVGHGTTGENPDDFLFVGAVTDVTEQMRTEETLRKQASLLNLTHDAIFVRNMSGVITYWNQGAQELYGWTAEEATGKVPRELLKAVFPIPLDQIMAELHSCERWEGEFVRTRKDGTQVTVASRWSLQRDARGVPVAALETNDDITLRKRAEVERERLRELEADLAHINRVSMLGELAASLTHELKQPITAAAMNADVCMRWLQRETPDLTQACRCASSVVADIKRTSNIIDGLRSLYSRSRTERESVNLNDIVREMTVLLRDAAHRHTVSIRNELEADLPMTMADRVQLQQVLMNLMLNGIEAMRDTGGELIVTSKKIDHGQLAITVSDSGIGLPNGESDRIFEAFFTTKSHGTGMGLSISRRIIEAHGGRLFARPNPGRGATFQFTLPAEASPT